MAISFVVIGLVAGIALGLYFKVLILIPVMSLAVAGTIAAGIARGDNVWTIALMTLAVMTALQIGYLIGIWLRSFIVDARLAGPSRGLAASSQAPRRTSTDAQLLARDLTVITECDEQEGQKHPVDGRSHDRVQPRTKVGPSR